jgi:hypothetical protein
MRSSGDPNVTKARLEKTETCLGPRTRDSQELVAAETKMQGVDCCKMFECVCRCRAEPKVEAHLESSDDDQQVLDLGRVELKVLPSASIACRAGSQQSLAQLRDGTGDSMRCTVTAHKMQPKLLFEQQR